MSTPIRRRFKTRRALTVTAAVAAVAATVTVSVQFATADETGPEAKQSCAMETLPIPEGLTSTKVTGMSGDGSVIAYYAEPVHDDDPDAPYETRPFLYSDGEATEVPMPGVWGQIADVNSAGVGAGYTDIDGKYMPYVWRDGKLSKLPGGRGEAHGINERGDIVGTRPGENGEAPPTLWPADGTGPVDLPMPKDAAWGTATAVADDGTIVGHITMQGDNSGNTKPYVWHPDGTFAELPLPEGVEWSEVSSKPMDIKGDWVSGILKAPGFEAPGIRWNLDEGTAEMTELGRDLETVAISGDGTVAGVIHGTPTAAYQSGETVVELPGAIDAADNINWDNAEEINDDGTLLAGTVWASPRGSGQNNWNAVTWTCE